ncbi:MAG: DUF2334 domain-containing protein [Peptococcaceae bacterium]|nr:DUF2334 domain-containing protein [Peptococcaceae bacterium]
MRKLGWIALLLAALVIAGCARSGSPGGGGKKDQTPSLHQGRPVKPALLRLEDVGPGGLYQSEESLEKLGVIAEFLQQEGVPFHVALIPRFVIPQKGYDVSIADDTPYARKFVTVIKDMQARGAIVGVHGYTHQSGNAASGLGFEFFDRSRNPGVPDTYGYAGDRIGAAMNLFEKAGVTPGFWETPHYTASARQYPAFEEQAGLLYENFYRGVVTYRERVFDVAGPGSRGFVIVPTPLGYIGGDVGIEKMLGYLDRVGDTQLASFFYHPFREFGYISQTKNDRGEIQYVYDRNSPLHRLIKLIKERGYAFVSVYSLVGFVPSHRFPGLPFREGDRVIAGRFEANGKSELLVFNRGVNQWHMYECTAVRHTPRKTNAFVHRGLWIEGWALDDKAVPLAGDFNGDRRDDLLVFDPAGGTFRLAWNEGGRLVPAGEEVPVPAGLRPVQPAVGDFNGDGLDDLAVHDPENCRIGVFFSTGRGFKRAAWQYIDQIGGEGQKLVAGDFNGDKKSDIAILDAAIGEGRVLLAGRSGGFTAAENPWLTDRGVGKGWHPFSSDINGDGFDDLVFYSRTGHWRVALSDGKSFVQRLEFGPWGAGKKGLPLVADLNGDGRSDLAIIDGSMAKGYNLDTALSVLDR